MRFWFTKSTFFFRVPRPFKEIQRFLDIEHEWESIVSLISQNKLNIFLLSFPAFISSFVSINSLLAVPLFQHVPPFTSLVTFLRYHLAVLLSESPHLIPPAVDFLVPALSDEKNTPLIASLIIMVFNDPEFKNLATKTSKDILRELLGTQDEKYSEISKDLVKVAIQGILENEAVRQELFSFFVELLKSKESVEAVKFAFLAGLREKQKESMDEGWAVGIKRALARKEAIEDWEILLWHFGGKEEAVVEKLREKMLSY